LKDRERQKKQKENEIVQLDAQLKQAAHSRKKAQDRLAQLQKDHPWIPHQAEQFGVQGGDFDFQRFTEGKLLEDIASLRDKNERMRKEVNFKVEQFAGQVEEEHGKLEKKEEIIRNNKD